MNQTTKDNIVKEAAAILCEHPATVKEVSEILDLVKEKLTVRIRHTDCIFDTCIQNNMLLSDNQLKNN